MYLSMTEQCIFLYITVISMFWSLNVISYMFSFETNQQNSTHPSKPNILTISLLESVIEISMYIKIVSERNLILVAVSNSLDLHELITMHDNYSVI